MKTAVIGVSFLFVLGTVWATPDATHSTSEEVATPLPIAGGVYEINVASNVTVTYSGAMTVDGAPVPPGLYGSADAPGVDTTYAAHFTGTGVVRVGSPGAMLIIR